MKYYLFIVEGVADIAALTKYLKLKGYKMIRLEKEVPSYWKDLIPKKYPLSDGDILKRVPVPTFFKFNDQTIAIYSAGADNKIVSTTNNTLTNLNLRDDALKELNAVGIFCDADNKSAKDRYTTLMSDFERNLDDEFKSIIQNHSFGEVTQNQSYKFGVYIFPDNSNMGVLEDLLLEGAQSKYLEVMNDAERYINHIESKKLDYIKPENLKGSERKKMLVGVIANTFRPGKANQVSIQDNDWINQDTMDNNQIQSTFKNFLDELLT